MTNTEINEIVAAVKRGEDGTAAKLYEATIEQALSYAMLCLRLGEQDAEDIVSESYLAAFSKLTQYETGTNFTAWLFKIIKNKAIDRKRKLKTAQDYERLVNALQADNSAESFTNAERKAALRNIIDTLPEKQREAVSLHYIEGLIVREVAERLGISENTAKTHIRRGFGRIRAAVLDNGNRDTWLSGVAALPLFRSMLQEDLKSGLYAMPTGTGAAVTTGAAAVAVSKIGIGVSIMGAGIGAKIGIASAVAILLVGGISVPMYIQAGQQREEQEAVAATVIQQQEAEAQAAREAEAAARATSEAEASRAAHEAELARQAEAERAASEQAETERLAAEAAETERLAAEAAAAAEAAEAARLDAERAAKATSEAAKAALSSQSGGASSQISQGQIPGRGGQTAQQGQGGNASGGYKPAPGTGGGMTGGQAPKQGTGGADW